MDRTIGLAPAEWTLSVGSKNAGVAQMVERSICNREVAGSTPAARSNSREKYVVAAVDKLVADGVPRADLRASIDALRMAWQAGYEAAGLGEPDVLRDLDQLHRAVMSGIRCYRSHHAGSEAAKALQSWESASLCKRIIGALKTLANGSGFVQFESRAQQKRARKLARRGENLVADCCAVDPVGRTG
jgi:hypothetical protein